MTSYVLADPEWQRLFFEFAAYAARHEDFRRELVKRYALLRNRIADLYRRRIERLGITAPVPVEQVSLMTFAMANGVALETLLEPERRLGGPASRRCWACSSRGCRPRGNR